MDTNDRLDGWKEIAAHIGKSERTAHRWHRELEMPVHRKQGEKGAIVFAFRSEIDTWLRDPAPEQTNAESGRRLFSRKGPPWSLVLGAPAALVLFALLWIALSQQAPAPESGVSPPGPLESDFLTLRGPRGLIVFVSRRTGDDEIYLVNDDGSDERRLTHHPGHDSSPAISPDGLEVAFSSYRSGPKPEVFIMNIDGSNVRQLTSGIEHDEYAPSGLSWHPDGSHLVVSFRTQSISELYQVAADGSGYVQLTASGEDSMYPRYSIDGSRIHYQKNTSFNGFTTELYEKVSGTQSRRLTFSGDNELPEDNKLPDEVIENGVRIIVFSKRLMPHKRSQLHKLYPDGSELSIYPEDNTHSEGGAVGPRGPGAHLFPGEIVFLSDRGGEGMSNLWRMRTDGKDAVRLTTTDATSLGDWWVPAEGIDHGTGREGR